METVELNVVTAAVLAEIAFDAAGDATNFLSKRYRETLEKMRRTGEFPQTWRPGSVDRTNRAKERSTNLGRDNSLSEPAPEHAT